MQIRMAQENSGYEGTLKIDVRGEANQIPIQNATIEIASTGEPDRVIEEVLTDSRGQTSEITLPTPPLNYSLTPGNAQPYSEYNLTIKAEGFENVLISGVEMLSGQLALQNVNMVARNEENRSERFVIGPHTLYGDYPPKIPESEVKEMPQTGEIVLSRIVVPEYVIVHDGPPSDAGAKNYYVRYRDYIKNVASSEIYATWPEETIKANVLAIMSFTLNRVYTEW